MSKRAIIISEEQLDELVSLGYGSDSSEDDFANLYGTETFVTGAFDNGEFGIGPITDKYTHDNNSDLGAWLGANSDAGRGIQLRESNKDLKDGTVEFSDEEKKILMSCPKDSVARNAALNGLKKKLLASTVSEFRTQLKNAENGIENALEKMGGKKAFDIIYRKYLEAIKFSHQKNNANDDDLKIDKKPGNKGKGTIKIKTKEGDTITFWE